MLSNFYGLPLSIVLAVRAEGFLEMIRFFTVLILNADETILLE